MFHDNFADSFIFCLGLDFYFVPERIADTDGTDFLHFDSFRLQLHGI